MKVLICLTSLGAGGTERSTALLLPELRRRGMDCEVAVFQSSQVGDEQFVREQGFAVHVLGGRTWVARTRRLRRLIRDVQPDIVHTAIFDADVAGRVAAMRTGAKVVSSLVNTSYDPARLADAKVPRWKLRMVKLVDGWTARHLTHRLHAVSHGVAASNVKHLRLDPSKITVVERGRPTASLPRQTAGAKAAARRELKLADDTPVVLAVGRLEFQKGHTHLVDAMASVIRHPGLEHCRTLIAGRDGSASPDVQDAIARTGLEEAITLLGHRDDIPILLAAADVFVLPSLYEGTAGAALEAMACGLPMVASKLPGMVGILCDRTNAIIVAPGDHDALAAGIAELLADGNEAARLGEAAAVAFRERFTLQTSADQMVAMYREVVTA